ncbi:MAG: aminopeptidase [Clostridiales bacterium]|jgi:aminopeptidase|nr:aminopeptidase [Clostridiales bacterium]
MYSGNQVKNQILASNLVNYSCRLKPGERIWIEAVGTEGLSLVDDIVKEVYKAGGVPFVNIVHEKIQRSWLNGATEEQIKFLAKYDVLKMEEMQAYIRVSAMSNQAELSDVPDDKRAMYQLFYNKPVNTDVRVPKTKWVVLTYPSAGSAQQAGKSSEAYEEFFYNVCNMDYKKMGEAMDKLVNVMRKTDKVTIKGPGCDFSFSIKDIPVIKCDGINNIPDGEVFTAPVKNSVNGYVTFNAPSNFQGYTFENIKLEFKDGKIINASANDTERINKILNTDDGARYVGEFAIGVNPYITQPAKNTLFDEKIAGSFHFTPGSCYDEAPNGNKSAIHWDMVCIQTPEYGGGEMYFDGELVRQNGIFVHPELVVLNPENLIG